MFSFNNKMAENDVNVLQNKHKANTKFSRAQPCHDQYVILKTGFQANNTRNKDVKVDFGPS